MDIRNLGVFANIKAVWNAYPDGGREGDYLFIGEDQTTGTKYRWNKYALLWENSATVTDTDGRQSEEVSDLNVQNDIIIGGDMSVQGGVSTETLSSPAEALVVDDSLEVRGSASVSGAMSAGSMVADGTIHADGNISTDADLHVGGSITIEGDVSALHVDWAYKGRFADIASLTAAYTSPKVGWWAQVGTSSSLTTYRCDTAGTWTNTSETSVSIGPEVITSVEMANVLG